MSDKTGKAYQQDSWFKVVGIGEEACKIVSKLSKKRHYLRNDECISIRKEDFICVKGVKNIDELQNYISDESVVWYVTSSGKAYQDVLKEVLKVTSPKVDYSLLFSVGEIDKSFAYSLIARGYINHFIETVGNTHDKTLKTIEGLLFFLFGFSLIGIDLCDVKLAFSVSPFIKADVIDIPKKNIENPKELEFLLRKIKKPASILLSLSLPKDGTFDDIYKVTSFVKKKLKNLILKIKNPYYNEGLELFFFSAHLDGNIEDIIRVVVFWAEKEEGYE